MQDSANAGKCVLIVEDNPLNMKLFSAMVAAQGFGVLQASDAPRGIDLAHLEQPDLIVLDVSLPGMSGVEAAQCLKADEETNDIPIILTTAYGFREGDEEVRASGCDAFMAKPIAVVEFIELIDSFMRRSTGQPRFVRHMIKANAGKVV